MNAYPLPKKYRISVSSEHKFLLLLLLFSAPGAENS